jgi:F-type H+-transporting ATPase subunit a
VKNKKFQKLMKRIAIAVAAWAGFGLLMTLIFGRSERGDFTVEIFSPSVAVGPVSVSECTLVGFLVTAGLAVAALVFRLFCVPRFTQVPKGLQNILELAIVKLDEFTCARVGTAIGETMSAYMLTLASFLVSCAALELFGIRSPSSDILVTFALAIITFFLINYYGIKEKGLLGRVKSYMEPTPIIAPIRMITDLALPVSMACRLFGNMIAGLIIMELIYYALGNFAVGLPAVIGLYFNVFHPLIQAFIFMTLTLSFIGEAVETPDKA